MPQHYKPLPTQERLQELFDYSVTTGHLTWKTGPWKGRVAGRTVNTKSDYFTRYLKVDTVSYLNHRIIWRLVTGEDPKDLQIDHKDGDPTNNAWHNLRLANCSQNTSNSGKRKRNTSGFKGVCRASSSDRWVAQITHNRENHYLGTYDTPEEAHAVYTEAAHRLKGEFARTA